MSSHLDFSQGAFWFDDGNVILTAQGVRFRVHQGVLARRSQVFVDMFADARQPFDDCPVVALSDYKYDVEHMLSALYDGEKYVPD